MHRTKLHRSVAIVALLFMQRVKSRHSTARASSGHRVFLASFIIASKVVNDDPFCNTAWLSVVRNMFSLQDINQMEREMCKYLDWDFTFDKATLEKFETHVDHDFSQDRLSYPDYPLSAVSKRFVPVPSTAYTDFHSVVRPTAGQPPSAPIFACVEEMPAVHPLKGRMFAFAGPSRF